MLRLEDYPVERILSSPTMRCRRTVEPLAKDRWLQIESVPALGVDARAARLRTILSDRSLRHAVLCTHGETIGQLFTQLARDGLEVEEPLDWPKGSTWLLRRAGVPGACSVSAAVGAGSGALTLSGCRGGIIPTG